MTDSGGTRSRITPGAITVLAYLHETDGTWSEVSREVDVSKTAVYRWLTELADSGILETETKQVNSYTVDVYRLTDEELGAAAQVIVDRLGPGTD